MAKFKTYNSSTGNWVEHKIDPAPHNHSWSEISSKPNFATVATSGNYNDLSNTPTIPSLSGYATETWVNNQGFGKSNLALGETSATAYRGDRGKTAYEHSISAHAPSDAQKNSDITKAEIEAKLTGRISSHSHSISDVTGLQDLITPVNNLTSTSTNQPLAASQGRILKNLIDSIGSNLGEPTLLWSGSFSPNSNNTSAQNKLFITGLSGYTWIRIEYSNRSSASNMTRFKMDIKLGTSNNEYNILSIPFSSTGTTSSIHFTRIYRATNELCFIPTNRISFGTSGASLVTTGLYPLDVLAVYGIE